MGTQYKAPVTTVSWSLTGSPGDGGTNTALFPEKGMFNYYHTIIITHNYSPISKDYLQSTVMPANLNDRHTYKYYNIRRKKNKLKISIIFMRPTGKPRELLVISLSSLFSRE